MINKLQARLSFEKAASYYDEAAVLQREIGNRLIERLDYIRFQPQRILDVGAGTGVCTFKLADRYNKSEIIALDFATSMLQQARQKCSWKSSRRMNTLSAFMKDTDLSGSGNCWGSKLKTRMLS